MTGYVQGTSMPISIPMMTSRPSADDLAAPIMEDGEHAYPKTFVAPHLLTRSVRRFRVLIVYVLHLA